jgi:DNA-binding NtrC family response regulator
LLRLVLRQRGHRVTEAETVAGAERAMAAGGASFDVLIADLELPDGRAEPLIAGFKRRHPAAAVIVASAHAQPRDVRSARAHGADLFLVKPYTTDMLLTAIGQFADCPPRDEVAPEGQS